MDLNYTAIPTFARIHADPNKYLFCRGPVGSGKSSGCIWHIVLNAMKQKPQWDGIRRSRYGILRASYPALKSTVVHSWRLWFKQLVNITYDTPIRGEISLPHPDGETRVGIELLFIALDREEDVNKLQSLELTGMHFNETAEIPRGVHQMSKSRINRFPAKIDGGAVDPFIICDYNSVDTEHWLYKIAEEETPPKHSFYHQPPALLMVDPHDVDPENPIVDVAGNHYVVNPDADNAENLDDDYYVDQVFGAEPDWVNVMILNNYGQVRTGKPVYPEYIDSIHCLKKDLQPSKGVKIVIGVDLGLTPAAAFMQLTPKGELVVFDELVTEDTSVRTFVNDYLKPHIINYYHDFNYEIIVDPAATARAPNDKKTAMQILRGAGLPARTAPTQDPSKRREAVVYFLRKLEGFQLSPKCTFLRKGFISEYKYGKKNVSLLVSSVPVFKEKPEKNMYSHIHDALQYGALELSEGRSVRHRKRYIPPDTHTGPAESIAGY